MSIQYAGGTIVNTTFNSDGTRAQLVAQLESALSTAGWTTVSGGGSGDVLMQSATTPQGLSIRFRLYDPGSGNCAQFTMKNAAGTLTSNIGYLLPTDGVTFRIIANKYQFFFFASGSAYARVNRRMVMGGTIWVPSFVEALLGADLECGWFQHMSSSDTDTTAQGSFRNRLGTNESYSQFLSSSLWLGYLVNYANNQNNTSPHLPILGILCTVKQGNLWADGSYPILEPLIGWSSDNTQTGDFEIKGMLWDALVLSGASVDGESTISYDGHTFMAITHRCADYSAIRRGTLYVRVA